MGARRDGKLVAVEMRVTANAGAYGTHSLTVMGVTATKTGGERNETQFPEYFVAAFDDPSADRDRNGHVSLAEAFEFARTKVVQAFQQKGLLLTEHAVLDDGGGGGLASTLFLGTGRTDAALPVDLADPAIKKLVDEKDAIDQQIAALKLKKSSMDEAQYEAQLEKLLTDLAVNMEFDKVIPAGSAAPISRTYPRQLTDLFQGEQLVWVGRYKYGGPVKVTLTGSVAGEHRTFTFPATVRSNSGSNPYCGSTWAMKKNQTPPTMPVITPEITKALSFTLIARTPSPRARPSSSRIARSCRPNLE